MKQTTQKHHFKIQEGEENISIFLCLAGSLGINLMFSFETEL